MSMNQTRNPKARDSLDVRTKYIKYCS